MSDLAVDGPRPDSTGRTVHAFTDDALGDDDLVGLRARLDAGEVAPAELAAAAISRVEAVDPALCAVAAERFAHATTDVQGRHFTTAGPFAGVPTFIKDNSDLAGLPTQHGTAAYAALPVTRDGDLAAHFRSLGLVPLGKTRLSEFGFSASAEPADDHPVRNPWHTDFPTGASSAGSAALVAAGAVPLAHANDGGGSIRIPAACTGLVGMKPSRGRVPQDKMLREMPLRIVADGVLTRSVRDTAAFLHESDNHHRNLRLPPIGQVTRPGRRRLRVALVDRSLTRDIDAETRTALMDTARLLESLGHRVEPVDPPALPSFEEDFLLYWGSLAIFMSSLGRFTLDRSFDADKVTPLTRGLAARSTRLSWRLPGAIGRLAATARQSRQFLAGHDVVLSPTLAHTTRALGHLDEGQDYDTVIQRLLEWVAFTPLQNVSGDPSMSLPLGQAVDGTPIGVMISAGAGQERRLLELGLEMEEARPFRRIQGA